MSGMMPDIEPGDWVLESGDVYVGIVTKVWDDGAKMNHPSYGSCTVGSIQEIRKADGTVWRASSDE